MFFNPIFLIFAFLFVILPQMLVKSVYSKFSKVVTTSSMTGGQVAKAILNDAGIYNVNVEPTQGMLSDHYDPTKKVIRLSEDIYHGSSIAAFGIAAHEVGHAIQDNKGYVPMQLRAGIFPAVMAGQTLGPLLLMAGLGLRYFAGMGGFTDLVAMAGIVLYGAVVVFQIVTLPVEFNASSRALQALAGGGYLSGNEISGAKKVLSAAALTYVAAALYALFELLYWVWVLFGNRRD